MTSAPILAYMAYHDRVPMVFRVEGGLHKIGGQTPYFTLTYTAHRRGFSNQRYSGGAGHAEILKHFPQFADLAALHLSDVDGVPMHAIANGWYFIEQQDRNALKSHFRLSDEAAGYMLSFVTTECKLEACVDNMRPRWKAEAEACIARHNLVVFGDA